ncbi:hypothetical protein CRYUN_Cryun30bG0050900 [Craigia yunnanensis]
MFVQVSPLEQDLGETISSLNFASRVRGVECGPVKRQADTAELQKLKQMVKELEGILKERTREFEFHSGTLQQKVNELEQKLRQHQEETMLPAYSAGKLQVTSITTQALRIETISGMDLPSRAMNLGSDLLEGTDSLRELRRKNRCRAKGVRTIFYYRLLCLTRR